jgi:hypothetical protein
MLVAFTNSNKGRSPKESFPDSQGNRKYYTPIFILYYDDYKPVSLSNRYIERPQFTETIASMLRTNVARNILSGITMPFDLARRAKKTSYDGDDDDRLHIAWSYEYSLSVSRSLS